MTETTKVQVVNLTIDGIRVEAPVGAPLLAIALDAGIKIPTLCALKGTGNIASCRICVVEVEGRDELVPACATLVEEGMVVQTSTPRVIAARKLMLDLLLSNHVKKCFSCPSNGDCELQNLCFQYGIEEGTMPNLAETRASQAVTEHPFLEYHPDQCVGCLRCVHTCARLTGRRAITVGRQATQNVILAPFGEGWDTSLCESCGNCAQACPVGALTEKRTLKYRAWETHTVRTTCPHCATGCQLDLVVKNGKIVDVLAADGPSNENLLCVKGRSGSFDFVDCEDRLRTPLIKNPETGEFEEATWDEALDLVAEKLTAIRDEFGGEALAGFACSRSTNEDLYMMQKMVRTAFKTNAVDNCARV